jgi:formylmethanofuran dehydrogenase subunit E
MCPVDAFQALLGCTFGRGKLIHKDYGKSVFTFHHREIGKTIRICRNSDQPVSSEYREKHSTIDANVTSDASATEPLPFEVQRQSQIQTILEQGQKLFTIQAINYSPPPTCVRTPTTICESCLEPTQIS